MFCSISGSVPEQPVVSSKSGHLFERKLIEKYVRETAKCPITGDPLSLDDLLPLKTSKTARPRTAPATSIPGLLGLFHDEWDALMLDTHTLRQQLHLSRQELSSALYQHDAACRVIARLIRERDEARAMLQDALAVAREDAAKRSAATAAGGALSAPEPKKAKLDSIPDAVLQELQEVNAMLSKGRKKRVIPESTATPDDLAALSLISSTPLHKTTHGGIAALDIHPDQPGVVVSAGLDGSLQLFDSSAGRQLASLEGHSKSVTGVVFASGSVIVSSSADKTARIWRQQETSSSFQCSAVLQDHSAEVTSIALHPSRKYFVTGSADASLGWWDLQTASCLRQIKDDSVPEAYSSVQFHPDGLILGTGTASAIRIWEVRQQKYVATLKDHEGAIHSMSFSENGYYMASAGSDGVRLWDLRRLKAFKSLPAHDGMPCHTATFDFSGQYLAVGGADARIYGLKQDWAVIRSFSDLPKKGVLSLKFGTDAKSLFVGATDHNLRVFGMAA